MSTGWSLMAAVVDKLVAQLANLCSKFYEAVAAGSIFCKGQLCCSICLFEHFRPESVQPKHHHPFSSPKEQRHHLRLKKEISSKREAFYFFLFIFMPSGHSLWSIWSLDICKNHFLQTKLSSLCSVLRYTFESVRVGEATAVLKFGDKCTMKCHHCCAVFGCVRVSVSFFFF